MQAYSSNDLYNQIIRQEASDAFRNNYLSEESYKKILLSKPCNLYMPNYFIRIALGLVTIIAVLFTAVLLGLLFASSGGSARVITLCFFLGVACYAALELIIKNKKYYNAGIDNILMSSVIIFFLSAFFVNDITTKYILISAISMAIALYLCVRFTDAFMAIVCYLSFVLFVFFLYQKLGTIAKTTLPFLMMILSVCIYVSMQRLQKMDRLVTYNFCLKSVMLLTLVTFYAACNYFVVKELSNQMLGPRVSIKDDLPMGWLFWIFTFSIPFIYIFYGIKRKDLLFIRTGLVLIAAAIFTIRYYHHVLSAEICMLIAGSVLIIVSYLLIQYLKEPRQGYTSAEVNPPGENLLNIEALIIARTLGTSSKTQDNSLFGGGSGGGGGATGNF
ncbi:MAG: hypothetical protein ABI691_10060 [Ginsengibacter sp.]